MSDAIPFKPNIIDLIAEEASTSKPMAEPKSSWPLMGDIVSARGGVPDHILEWRRAQGYDDPAPQLKAPKRK